MSVTYATYPKATHGSGLYWVPPRNPCRSGTVEMTEPSCRVLLEEHSEAASADVAAPALSARASAPGSPAPPAADM